jgi:hypothetical protein
MRGKPFEAGNKFGKGRRRGSRNKRTAFAELMEDHGEAMIKQCQVLALKGDSTALRLCMERLMPPCRAHNNRFRLPPIRTVADLVKALPVVAQAVARGRLSAQEGESISRMMEGQRRTIESEEFEKRLRALEKGRKSRPPKEGKDL